MQISNVDRTAERIKALHELAINMRTRTMQYVHQFIEHEGMRLLLDLIAGMDYSRRQVGCQHPSHGRPVPSLLCVVPALLDCVRILLHAAVVVRVEGG